MNITFNNIDEKLLKESYRTLAAQSLYTHTMMYIKNRLSEIDYSDFIYDILTKDHSWDYQRSRLSSEEKQAYTEYAKHYNTFLRNLSTNIKKLVDKNQNSLWTQSVSSWFYLLKNEAKPKAKIQKKLYITIDKRRENFSKNLDGLNNFFTLLNNAPLKGRKHFKVPFLYKDFMHLVDNLVIYCDEDSDMPTLEDIVVKSGLICTDRTTLDRVSKGVDGPHGSGQSDTQLIANEFVTYINNNKENIKLTKKSPEEVAQLLSKILSNFSLNASHR